MEVKRVGEETQSEDDCEREWKGNEAGAGIRSISSLERVGQAPIPD